MSINFSQFSRFFKSVEKKKKKKKKRAHARYSLNTPPITPIRPPFEPPPPCASNGAITFPKFHPHELPRHVEADLYPKKKHKKIKKKKVGGKKEKKICLRPQYTSNPPHSTTIRTASPLRIQRCHYFPQIPPTRAVPAR
jgi:hypothetical protein